MSIRSQLAAIRGELGAMYLQGLNDLHNAIVPAFPESQHGVEQLGTPLAPTSQMVTRDVEPLEAAEYSKESDRNLEAMFDRFKGQAREQEMEMERE